MFDIGWQEFILIALVAVVVVGPKDLPRVIRTVGQWVRKARSLASEFQGSLEEMAREAELDDVRKQLQQVSKDGVGASIEKHVDPTGEIRQSFEEAKSSSGADEIESALDEARRGASSIASGTDVTGEADRPSEPLESYETLAERNRIPDNSVVPPPADPASPPAAVPPAADQSSPSEPATESVAEVEQQGRKPAIGVGEG